MASRAPSPTEPQSPPPRPDQDGTAAPTSAGSPAQAGSRARSPVRRPRRRVSWYATLLIVATLLLAAGSELWRWILLILTLD